MEGTTITWSDSKPATARVETSLRAHVLKLAHAMMSKKPVFVNGSHLEFCEGVSVYDWNTLYEVKILSISPTEVFVESTDSRKVKKNVVPLEVYLKNK
jgi:hypothetical protein